jgi:phytoene/squalene synthetase
MTPRDRESAGYAECERITRRHGTTYYWGARLLPVADRRHVYALYSLARLADDIVDHPGALDTAQVADRLTRFEADFWASLTTPPQEQTDPVRAAIARTVAECELPDEYAQRFFTAMRTDLVRDHYDTWADLLGYMDGSAAVIGEMMLPVLRPRPDADGTVETARQAARALGLAFQLTNFLRDVAEDLDRGRVYLPAQELAAFGVELRERRVTREWRSSCDSRSSGTGGSTGRPTSGSRCCRAGRGAASRRHGCSTRESSTSSRMRTTTSSPDG